MSLITCSLKDHRSFHRPDLVTRCPLLRSGSALASARLGGEKIEPVHVRGLQQASAAAAAAGNSSSAAAAAASGARAICFAQLTLRVICSAGLRHHCAQPCALPTGIDAEDLDKTLSIGWQHETMHHFGHLGLLLSTAAKQSAALSSHLRVNILTAVSA